jgi:hypothetical protein
MTLNGKFLSSVVEERKGAKLATFLMTPKQWSCHWKTDEGGFDRRGKRLYNVWKCCDIDIDNENRRPEPLRSMTYKAKNNIERNFEGSFVICKSNACWIQGWEKGRGLKCDLAKSNKGNNATATGSRKLNEIGLKTYRRTSMTILISVLSILSHILVAWIPESDAFKLFNEWTESDRCNGTNGRGCLDGREIVISSWRSFSDPLKPMLEGWSWWPGWWDLEVGKRLIFWPDWPRFLGRHGGLWCTVNEVGSNSGVEGDRSQARVQDNELLWRWVVVLIDWTRRRFGFKIGRNF